MEEVGETLAVRAHEKGLEYICRVSPRIPALVKGDPGRLRQVLMNLTANAIKFTSSGEVLIAATLEAEDPASATIRFIVSDTGIGIPESMASTLFDAFTQADASTTRKFGGTGLGLAISDRLVKLMGGQIGVETRQDQGSLFWFTASFAKPESQPEPDPEQAEMLALLQNQRILVVDDNTSSRQMLRELLEHWQCCPEAVADAGSALSRLARASATGSPYSVALVDLDMPDTSGDQLVSMIRQEPVLKDTGLVLMTSFRSPGTEPDLESAACLLAKPVRRARLSDCLLLSVGIQPRQPCARPGAAHAGGRADIIERKVRVLLVEDNPTNQLVTLSILSKHGFQTDVVSNGLEAVTTLERSPYDLVLMDVQMPEMDGLEATRRIREAESSSTDRDVPIIAMTAHAMKGDRERCLAAGMNEYLAKPFSPQSLLEVIERLLPKQPLIRKPTLVHKLDGIERPADHEVFDRHGLLMRIGGDPTLLHEIEAAFLEDAVTQIESITRAVNDRDAAMVEAYGHALKSACAGIGANAFKEVAYRVEQAGNAGQIDVAEGLIDAVREELTRIELVIGHH
jgi:CheY-like chemotaxis protein/HPt (histidine-containing phosphotransfer) domain-containing protein